MVRATACVADGEGDSMCGNWQDEARIHDEWPWSAHKYSKLSCAGNTSSSNNNDVLLPV